MTTQCDKCPLREFSNFEQLTKDEVAFTQKFKKGEFSAQPGTEILSEGAPSPRLFTVLKGMGLRYKMTASGQRQITGFVLPGDFLGLQSGLMDEMRHSVEATTAMQLCVFNRANLWDLFQNHPRRAFDLTHLAAREESLLGESLMVIGQMDGPGKVAWALWNLHARLSALDLGQNNRVPLPYRQQDLADALGLSLVHTNKTLQKLKASGVVTWAHGYLEVHDLTALAKLGQITKETLVPRPLI